MNHRLKEFREALELSQARFAKELHMGQTSISAMERGTLPITDRTISQLVDTFGLDETWLRTGNGFMFSGLNALPAEDENLIAIFSDVTYSSPTRKRFVTAFCRMAETLTDEQINALCTMLETFCVQVREK